MNRVVALPMYAIPAEAEDAVWRGLRDALCRHGVADVPAEMARPTDLDTHWRDPNLLLSQTCGYPFATHLSDAVQIVGTPHYEAEGCDGFRYSSVVVVRADDPARTLADLRGRRAAINHVGSHSGWNGLRALVAPLAKAGRFFGAVTETGSHHESMRHVGADLADGAAIDAVTFALARAHRPDLVAPLRVLGRTASVPGLPFVTARRTSAADLARLRAALDDVFADPALAAARHAMLLDGWSPLRAEDYDEIRQVENRAAALGYPVLA